MNKMNLNLLLRSNIENRMQNHCVHGCSEKQARSVGSHATRHLLKGLHKKGFRQLDVYSLDMNEELSGLSGYHLWDQVRDLAHLICVEPNSLQPHWCV